MRYYIADSDAPWRSDLLLKMVDGEYMVLALRPLELGYWIRMLRKGGTRTDSTTVTTKKEVTEEEAAMILFSARES